MYYFKVDVREGAPGWADDDSYTSNGFKTFADVYEALVHFRPSRHWSHLRYVQMMYLWKEGQPKVPVHEDGCVIEVNNLAKLDVLEEEFDRIIENLNKQL